MKVLKFGGTSVGTASRMKDVAKLICDGNQKIVVLSAMSGTTNSLVEISDYFYKNNTSGALEKINVLLQKYYEVIEDLYDLCFYFVRRKSNFSARRIDFYYNVSITFTRNRRE